MSVTNVGLRRFANTRRFLYQIKRRDKAIIGKDQLLWDLGMPTLDLENATKVRQKIEAMDRQFDLVLIVERFEEVRACARAQYTT